MSQYIELEKAVSIIEEKQKELCPVGRYGRVYVYGLDREKYDNWEEIIDALENIPAADVIQVVHGKWIKRNGYTECSECEYWYDSPDSEDSGDRSKYCPNCGAKMDLADD